MEAQNIVRKQLPYPMHQLPCSASQDASQRKRKRVCFAAEGALHQQIEWMQGDATALWHTPADYKAILARVKPIVKAMRQDRNDILAMEAVCTRGLEHLQSSMHFEQQNINKDCVIHAVLEEQRRQRSKGIRDEVAISRASQLASQWARNKSLQLAASDEAAIRLEKIISEEERVLKQSAQNSLHSVSRNQANGDDGHLRKQSASIYEQQSAAHEDHLRSWLNHQDSLQRMSCLEPLSSRPSKTSLSYSSLSSDNSIKSIASGKCCIPLPLEKESPNVEQAFAA